MTKPTQDDDDRRAEYAALWADELGAHVPEYHGATYAEHRRLRAREHARTASRARQAAAPDPNRRA